RHGPGADGHRADVAGAGGLSHPLLGQPDGGLKIILEFPCRFLSIARPPLQSFIAIRGAAMSCLTPPSLTAAERAALFGLGLPLLVAPWSLPALADGHSYSIAAGALDEALNTFARQAGVLLSFDPALTAGRQSPGLRGHYEVDQGFGLLLAGTGLRAVDTGAGGYRLEPSPQARDGSLELQSQTISGRYGEYARGPVRGYVATRSGSATKTDTSILETPQSISVVSRAEMDARAVTTVEEALRYTPSVAVPYGYDTRYDWVSIRGFDSKNQIFRDGMKQSSSLYGLPRPDA